MTARLCMIGVAVFLSRAQVGAQERADSPPARSASASAALDDEELLEIYEPTEVTRAVDRALEFLSANQLADGSWLCGWGKNTGVISLTMMAFLAAGHVPGRGEYGELIDDGLRFLLQQQKEGMIIRERDTSHGPLYEHGISTLLLGEVRGMVDPTRPGLEQLERIHQRGVDLILRAQRVRGLSRADTGGWRYTPSARDADLSVSGWQLLALRAAEDSDLDVPAGAIEQAVAYVKRCTDASGGFTYMPQRGYEPTIAMTGTGILALEICGEFGTDEARRGGDWLLKNRLAWSGPFFFYSVYYSTQAMFQLGGEYWKEWRALRDELLVPQQRADGSWLPPQNETSIVSQLGPVYGTAMAVLSLTVEYKYLPIYQR